MDPSLADFVLGAIIIAQVFALLGLSRRVKGVRTQADNNLRSFSNTISLANAQAGHTTGAIEKMQQEIDLLTHLVGVHGTPVHTHTLTKRSEHEDAGKKIVVKMCEECDMVFRDRKEEE